jgi:hypothetical protein
MRFVLGTVNHIDPRQKVVSWAGPGGRSRPGRLRPAHQVVSWAGLGGAADQVGYDRLILTAGSVNKLLPIPGVVDYAHGFRSRGSHSRMGHRDPGPLEARDWHRTPGDRGCQEAIRRFPRYMGRLPARPPDG